MNWNEKIGEKNKKVPFSGIRKFFDLAASMDEVISLAVGEPDFPALDKVIRACVESL